MQTMSAENLFSRSWELLSRNWAIIVPGLIVGIIAGIVSYLLLPTVYYNNGYGGVTVSTWGFLGASISIIVQTLAAIITISYTTGMAAAAWRTGTATFSDGAAAFSKEGSRVFTAMLALIIVWIGAAILTPFTLGLSLLAVFYLFVYTMAAAVISNYGGFAALGESYKMAISRWQTTVIIVIVLAVVSIVAAIIGAILHVIPFIGPLVSAAIEMAVLAYFTLVIVGEWMAQAAEPVPVGVASTAATAPPSSTIVQQQPPPTIVPPPSEPPAQQPPP